MENFENDVLDQIKILADAADGLQLITLYVNFEQSNFIELDLIQDRFQAIDGNLKLLRHIVDGCQTKRQSRGIRSRLHVQSDAAVISANRTHIKNQVFESIDSPIVQEFMTIIGLWFDSDYSSLGPDEVTGH